MEFVGFGAALPVHLQRQLQTDMAQPPQHNPVPDSKEQLATYHQANADATYV